MDYEFVNVDAFVPNSISGWTQVGNITSFSQDGKIFYLWTDTGLSVQLSFLSPTAFRVRFRAPGDKPYAVRTSYAVVTQELGQVMPQVLSDTDSQLVISTGALQLNVNRLPYGLSVYRGKQLIHADQAGRNIVYSQGPAVACFKVVPQNALYFGFGEKAGSQLAKNNFAMTFFNYDNFIYSSGPLPAYEDEGPLNPTETLYNSTPFLIETNPAPEGDYAGAPYSYGLFLDNPAQAYFNITANIPTEFPSTSMSGLYYFGALYGELDYYFMAGDDVRSVLQQYTQLTGQPPLPPKYVLGYHQGCYGYYDKSKLMAAARAYRENSIPIDGLHIDVDFQDNYRTFTSSELKFPNVKQIFDELHDMGFKCSTNITAIISSNPQDENGGTSTPYSTRDEGLAKGYLLYNTRASGGESPEVFTARESYGTNLGTNPYQYPPLTPNDQGQTPLGTAGYYPNLGDPEVQEWWGRQYSYLLSVGLDMIWQDMTCPATQADVTPTPGTQPSYAEQMEGLDDVPDDTVKSLPLDLMMATPDGNYLPNAVVHNAYALLLCQATWNGINKLRPDKRNFIIARGGYAGMQRYAALWTGDSASSWDFLRINIPEVLNLGLSGQPLSGCDIGGFANGSGSSPYYFDPSTSKIVGGITDPELFVRWMNLGAFLPWYRNHYDGYSKQYQEPYAYGEPYLSYCRKYINLRYRMLQIFYDAMYQATQTGLPIARAMFLNFPNDPQVYSALDDQFFVGDYLLVAPIVQQGSNTRNIYLPQGASWYAFQDEDSPLLAPVAGGTLIGVSEGTSPYYAPLGEVPLYVQAGAILPMRQVEQWVGQLAQNPLTFQIYPGPDTTYTLYQDDGVSTSAQKQGAYRLTRLSTSSQGSQRSIRVQRTYDQYTPPEQYYLLALLGTPQTPQAVSLGNKALAQVSSGLDGLRGSQVNAWCYEEATQITYIKVFDTQSDITVVVS